MAASPHIQDQPHRLKARHMLFEAAPSHIEVALSQRPPPERPDCRLQWAVSPPLNTIPSPPPFPSLPTRFPSAVTERTVTGRGTLPLGGIGALHLPPLLLRYLPLCLHVLLDAPAEATARLALSRPAARLDGLLEDSKV